MAGATRTLLVSCYELGQQPQQLAASASRLRAAGHDVRLVDTDVENLDDALLDWASVLAVSVPMHTAMRLADPLVRRARARRGGALRILLVGLYAPISGAELEPGLVDGAVGGEYEDELAARLEGAGGARQVVLDRLTHALPARDLLPPLDRYARLVEGERRVLTGRIEATRGCVHRCRHCPVPVVYDGRIRVVDPRTVVADAEQLWAMGARHLTFADPDFLNAVPHTMRTARLLHEALPDATFDVTTKVEHILEHRNVWPELRELGLLFVVTAVESTSDLVLRILDKGHTHADTLEAVRLLRAHGVTVRPSLLPFTPWTAFDDIVHLQDFIDGSDLVDAVDPVQLTIRLLLPPGSLLLLRPEMRPFLTGTRDAGGIAWRHPDPGLDALQARLAALVAADADAGADPRLTHSRIREEIATEASIRGARRPAGGVIREAAAAGPRLSEPWFC